MSKNNSGRSTTGGPAVPRYPTTPEREAAMHLRLTCTRFLTDRASRREVDEAHRTFAATTTNPTRPEGGADR